MKIVKNQQVSDIVTKKKRKKHKRDKRCNSVNTNDAFKDISINEIVSSHEVVYLDESISDSMCKKKHKQSKERCSIITQDSLPNEPIDGISKKYASTDIEINDESRQDKDINQFPNCYELPSNLDEQRPDIMHKRKRKRHRSTINSTDALKGKDINQFLNCYELPANLDEQVSDIVTENKRKKHKKDKCSNSGNTTDAFKVINMNEIVSSHEVVHLDESISDSMCEKKHKQAKERCSIITVDSLPNEPIDGISKNYASIDIEINDESRQDKDINQFPNCYELPPNLDKEMSDILTKKKHKKHKKGEHSNSINATDAFKDISMNEILNSHEVVCLDESISDGMSKKKHKRAKDKKSYSTIIMDALQNEPISDIPNNCANTNIERNDESRQNLFEISQKISNESFKRIDSFHLDFIEEPVDFEIPPLHIRETITRLSEQEKNNLISLGVAIKMGKFTHTEDTMLLKNFENFVKTFGELDIRDMFGLGKRKTDYIFLKFLRSKHFYVRLGKGLNDRTLHSIYKRARLLLHPYRNKPKFDDTELKGMKCLHQVLNNKWNQIGDILERSDDNCLQTYRWNEKDISRGKWTKEEEKQLMEAIEKVTGSSDMSCDKMKGISWDTVAAHIPTRNFSQCRMHWAYHLAWKPGPSKQQKWNEGCFKKLIGILREDWYVESASDIDWLKVHESFEDIAPSHLSLQKRWLYVKSLVPGYKTMNYKNIINELCKKYNITHDETCSAPFSSSVRNQRFSQCLENIRTSTEDVISRLGDV